MPDDLPHDLPRTFQVGLPLWYLVHRGTGEIHSPDDRDAPGLTIGHVLVKLEWGHETALALFTDEERALAFAARMSIPGLLSLRVATVPQFRELLLRLLPGTTHVGFDPRHPSAGRETMPVVPVEEILETIRTVGDET